MPKIGFCPQEKSDFEPRFSIKMGFSIINLGGGKGEEEEEGTHDTDQKPAQRLLIQSKLGFA